jgi:hypothetical protein
MAYQNNAEPNKDIATRSGEFAMLIFSIGRLLMKNHIRSVAQKSDPIPQLPWLPDPCSLTWLDGTFF